MASPDGRPPGPPPAERPGPAIVAAVATGGALGAATRYSVADLLPTPPGTFPWTTFWVNVSGSFVLGFLLVLVVARFSSSRFVRPFFASGFLGAFTTFSTFTLETDLLLRDGHAGTAAAYVATSLVGGLVAVWLGVALGRRFPTEPVRPGGR